MMIVKNGQDSVTLYPMSPHLIYDITQVTPEWLTTVLTRSGALNRGSVTAFETSAGQGNWSRNAVLQLRYSDDAQGERPSSLFLKMVNTDTGDGETFGPSEVHYYTRDYRGVRDTPLLRCYDAHYSPDANRYHLLLQDVSQTHVTAERPPTLSYGLALAEGMAILHAHWWGAERLAQANAPIHDAAHIHRFIDVARPGAEQVTTHLAPELADHWPDAIRHLFKHYPDAMVARTADDNGFTIIHGDPNQFNILVPMQGTVDEPLYLIDRQPFNWSLTTWLGVFDIAYAIVLDWPSALRRQWERPLLRHYHETLVRRGVQHYGWQQLWDDYRLCIGICVCVMVEYFRGGVDIKWRDELVEMLRRTLTACDELNSYELWS